MLSTVFSFNKTEVSPSFGHGLLLLFASQHFPISKQASKHLTLPS